MKKRTRGFEIVKGCKYKIELPTRGTKHSAGYDLRSPYKVMIKPGETKMIMSGVKAYMQKNEVAEMYIRSSVAIKKRVELTTGVSVIDSDYYGNPKNDGEIGIPLFNRSDSTVTIEAHERVAQIIFKRYLTVENDDTKETRTGGVGSTN